MYCPVPGLVRNYSVLCRVLQIIFFHLIQVVFSSWFSVIEDVPFLGEFCGKYLSLVECLQILFSFGLSVADSTEMLQAILYP